VEFMQGLESSSVALHLVLQDCLNGKIFYLKLVRSPQGSVGLVLGSPCSLGLALNLPGQTLVSSFNGGTEA
jgi:hypothetical protein